MPWTILAGTAKLVPETVDTPPLLSMENGYQRIDFPMPPLREIFSPTKKLTIYAETVHA